jgi:hypothetical protein
VEYNKLVAKLIISNVMVNERVLRGIKDEKCIQSFGRKT